MQTAKRKFAIVALVFVLLGSTGANLYQTPEGRFFADTGHWLTGEFLAFYMAAPNPILLFGYPITEPLDDPMRPGITIQYFHKARFDYNPNEPSGKRVSLANLGEWMYNQDNAATVAEIPTNTGACRIFAAKNLPVCYAFLQFYDANKGEVYFGNPISPVLEVNGRLVQYFERARMEWMPEQAPGNRVGLAFLGRMNFDSRFGDPRLLAPSRNLPNITSNLMELRVNAFVGRALSRPGEQQQVYVIVQNQHGIAVEGANVIITVLRPDGKVENYRPSPTNSFGLTESSFKVPAGLPNQISRVDVQVEIVNGPRASAVTWFRIWW